MREYIQHEIRAYVEICKDKNAVSTWLVFVRSGMNIQEM
jgi:hypothetical protein